MKVEGGCYCGAVRYEINAQPVLVAQCHCRECQYYSGGHPNAVVVVPASGFRMLRGEARHFRRSDLDAPVTRAFCAECGTPLFSLSPERMPDLVIVKLGTLDEPAAFGNPTVATFTQDMQPFHYLPPDIRPFERLPG